MAQQFTLKLVNPALAQTQTPNEIFTGLQGGNKLDLILTNLSGFDTSFAPSNGGDLLVKFPASILDEAAARKVTVAAPWTLDGIDTPATDPDKGDNQADYVLKLKPPAGPGVAFQANASVTVSLADIEPTAKGNATVVAAYQFTDLGLSMNVNDQLAVLGSREPGQQAADRRRQRAAPDGQGQRRAGHQRDRGDEPAGHRPERGREPDSTELRLPGPEPARRHQTNAELGRLVPKWDPLNPPTFRIQFPYYGGTGDFAAPQDLTDDRQRDDPNYNDYTSAWNIKLSLSRTDPNNTQNDWWTIQLDPRSTVPSWLIQPTQQNKYLFTGTNQGPNAPGPFLDLFFSHVYTDLPIDASKPETILFLETYDFPGFNDRLQQQPIFKEPSVQICSFSGSVTTQGGVTTLTLSWEAENADHCLISGDANKYDPVSIDAFSRTIDLTNKLKSSYTLTAVGTDGVSKLQRTIDVRWTEGTRSSTNRFQNPTAIELSPDGKSIYLVGDNALNVLDCQHAAVAGRSADPARRRDGHERGCDAGRQQAVPGGDAIQRRRLDPGLHFDAAADHHHLVGRARDERLAEPLPDGDQRRRQPACDLDALSGRPWGSAVDHRLQHRRPDLPALRRLAGADPQPAPDGPRHRRRQPLLPRQGRPRRARPHHVQAAPRQPRVAEIL